MVVYVFPLFHQHLGQAFSLELLSLCFTTTTISLSPVYLLFFFFLITPPPVNRRIRHLFPRSLSPSHSLLDAPVPVNTPQARGRTARMLKSA